MRELIIGGARSGKSTLALQRAQYATEVVYVATAPANTTDVEMQARIARHRAQRPAHWRTVECPQQLAQTLLHWDQPQRCVIVDCLTLWLSNVLWDASMQVDAAAWQIQRAALLECLPRLNSHVILVSNEVGQGIVPDNAAARRFRDEQGWLNQLLATACEQVTLAAAGLPLMLKTPSVAVTAPTVPIR